MKNKLALIGTMHGDVWNTQAIPHAIDTVFDHKDEFIVTAESSVTTHVFMQEKRKELLQALESHKKSLESIYSKAKVLIIRLFTLESHICEKHARIKKVEFECIDHPNVDDLSGRENNPLVKIQLDTIIKIATQASLESLFPPNNYGDYQGFPDECIQLDIDLGEAEGRVTVASKNGPVARDLFPASRISELLQKSHVVHFGGVGHLIDDLSGEKRTLYSHLKEYKPERYLLKDFHVPK